MSNANQIVSEWSPTFVLGKLNMFLFDPSLHVVEKAFRGLYLLFILASFVYLIGWPTTSVAGWKAWEVVVFEVSLFTGLFTVFLAAVKIYKWSLLTGIIQCLTYAYVQLKGGVLGDAFTFGLILSTMSAYGLYAIRSSKDLQSKYNKKSLQDYAKSGAVLAVFILIYLNVSYLVTHSFDTSMLTSLGFKQDNWVMFDMISNIMYVVAQTFYILGMSLQWWLWELINAYYIYWDYVIYTSDPVANAVYYQYGLQAGVFFVNGAFAIYFWYRASVFDRLEIRGISLNDISVETVKTIKMNDSDKKLLLRSSNTGGYGSKEERKARYDELRVNVYPCKGNLVHTAHLACMFNTYSHGDKTIFVHTVSDKWDKIQWPFPEQYIPAQDRSNALSMEIARFNENRQSWKGKIDLVVVDLTEIKNKYLNPDGSTIQETKDKYWEEELEYTYNIIATNLAKEFELDKEDIVKSITVYGSEPEYGQFFMKNEYIKAYELIDQSRELIHISATRMREEGIYNHWEKMIFSQRVMLSTKNKYVIASAESGGKSVTAEAVAEIFDFAYSPEVARKICTDMHTLGIMGYRMIMNGQLADWERAAKEGRKAIICDTDLVTTYNYLINDTTLDKTSDEYKHLVEALKANIMIVRKDITVFMLSPNVNAFEQSGPRFMGKQEVRSEYQRSLAQCYKDFGYKVVYLECENIDPVLDKEGLSTTQYASRGKRVDEIGRYIKRELRIKD